MKITYTIEEVRKTVRAARNQGAGIGCVPTMGALHPGHGSLIEAAAQECDFVVVSIFINPTQFGLGEDLDTYPRTLEADCQYCEKRGANLVFAPTVQEMYPTEQLTWIDVEKLTDPLCGAKRPGHFRGVTTVCAKLFNITQPDIAYFGQKDAQQAIVIQRMVRDLNMPLQIRICPIIREPDGLAMSSRNQYLSPDERQRAVCLYQALTHCKEQVDAGQRDAAVLKSQMQEIIQQQGAQIEYVEIVDAETLSPPHTLEGRVLIAVAVVFGKTRLIDNFLLDLNKSPKRI